MGFLRWAANVMLTSVSVPSFLFRRHGKIVASLLSLSVETSSAVGPVQDYSTALCDDTLSDPGSE